MKKWQIKSIEMFTSFLLKYTIFILFIGAIICMASLTSSISKNMDFLCLDNEHLARQELVRQHLPQGISEGLTQGLSVFGLSVLGTCF